MEKGLKPIGKLSDVELANALNSSKVKPLSEPSNHDIKDRNILMNELLRVEKERFQAQQALITEWARLHPRFSTDVELIKTAVSQLHEYVRGQLQELPVDKGEQQRVTSDLEKKIDDANDLFEDKMFQLEEQEISVSREEAMQRRRERDGEKARAALKARQEAERKAAEELRRKKAEEARIEAERKAAEEKAVAERMKRMKEIRSRKDDVPDNVMVMNLDGINSNLLTFSSRLGTVVRAKGMAHASMARTKAGSLVIVCRKADASRSENVRISVHDGKTACSIANNSFCRYIRNMYSLNDSDEYSFDVKFVAYADDIKIKIEGVHRKQ